MKILYFSATGNCLYVAKQIGEELFPIKDAIKTNTYFFKDDIIGVVLPVYWLSVPAIVRSFLEKASFECEYLFGIVTYGDNMYGAMNDLNSIAIKNGRRFDYINAVKMTENYLPMYEMAKEIDKAKQYDTTQHIQLICEEISKRKYQIPKISWFSKQITNLFKKKHCMSIGKGESAKFEVSKDCVKCNTCVDICPMNNVKLLSEGITFDSQCADCLGCIQNCPQQAIHMKDEKSSIRYRHPQITLQELIGLKKER